jgi:hypothetical protein
VKDKDAIVPLPGVLSISSLPRVQRNHGLYNGEAEACAAHAPILASRGPSGGTATKFMSGRTRSPAPATWSMVGRDSATSESISFQSVQSSSLPTSATLPARIRYPLLRDSASPLAVTKLVHAFWRCRKSLLPQALPPQWLPSIIGATAHELSGTETEGLDSTRIRTIASHAGPVHLTDFSRSRD